MPAQREEDEARIRQQVGQIVEGIQAKDRSAEAGVRPTSSFDVEPPLQHVGVEAKLKN